jgi:hypothetical protein
MSERTSRRNEAPGKRSRIHHRAAYFREIRRRVEMKRLREERELRRQDEADADETLRVAAIRRVHKRRERDRKDAEEKEAGKRREEEKRAEEEREKQRRTEAKKKERHDKANALKGARKRRKEEKIQAEKEKKTERRQMRKAEAEDRRLKKERARLIESMRVRQLIKRTAIELTKETIQHLMGHVSDKIDFPAAVERCAKAQAKRAARSSGGEDSPAYQSASESLPPT